VYARVCTYIQECMYVERYGCVDTHGCSTYINYPPLSDYAAYTHIHTHLTYYPPFQAAKHVQPFHLTHFLGIALHTLFTLPTIFRLPSMSNPLISPTFLALLRLKRRFRDSTWLKSRWRVTLRTAVGMCQYLHNSHLFSHTNVCVCVCAEQPHIEKYNTHTCACI
jgi:hypothetical protein